MAIQNTRQSEPALLTHHTRDNNEQISANQRKISERLLEYNQIKYRVY